MTTRRTCSYPGGCGSYAYNLPLEAKQVYCDVHHWQNAYVKEREHGQTLLELFKFAEEASDEQETKDVDP